MTEHYRLILYYQYVDISVVIVEIGSEAEVLQTCCHSCWPASCIKALMGQWEVSNKCHSSSVLRPGCLNGGDTGKPVSQTKADKSSCCFNMLFSSQFLLFKCLNICLVIYTQVHKYY